MQEEGSVPQMGALRRYAYQASDAGYLRWCFIQMRLLQRKKAKRQVLESDSLEKHSSSCAHNSSLQCPIYLCG